MIGWAIIGIGGHANNRMAPAFSRAHNARLVAAGSRDRDRAAAFARQHGAEAGYDSFEDLLAHPGVQVVYVATPHNLHRDFVVRAARAGKHVLCEKPMALTVADASAMVEACRDAGTLLGLAFQNRHHPAHRDARRLVAEGRVGQVALVRAQYSRLAPEPRGWRTDPVAAGAGSLMAHAVHALDLVRYATGEEVVEVGAMMDVPPEAGVVDTAVAMVLRLSGGGFALVDSNRSLAWGNNDLVVTGSRGRVATLGTVGATMRGSLEMAGDGVTWRADYSDPDPATALYAAMVEQFSGCAEEGGQPAATGEDGLAVVAIVEAILRSWREARLVRVAP